MSSSAPPVSDSLTLEQVKERFSLWRKTRAKRSKIPEELWEAVSRLIKEQRYASRQVAVELGLNYQQMQSKVGNAPEQKCLSPQAPDFIKVPLSPISSSSSHPLSLEQKIFYPRPVGTLEIVRPDGAVLKASGIEPKDLCSFIKDFLGQ